MVAVMYYTLVTFIQNDGIECDMKKCRIVYCFCRSYKIMYSTSFSDTQWLQADNFVW